jgi:hypothetical protein
MRALSHPIIETKVLADKTQTKRGPRSTNLAGATARRLESARNLGVPEHFSAIEPT